MNIYVKNFLLLQISEELGLPYYLVYHQIKNSTPIKKTVHYGVTHSVEHYYFAVIISPQDYAKIKLNEHEIDVSYLEKPHTLS